MQAFVAIAEAIATLLHPNAEVVLHDLKTLQIAHIANNFSRRNLGDSSLTEVEELGELTGSVVGPYPKTNFDGRELKSVSAILRNTRGKPVALLCINLDVSGLKAARLALDSLIGLTTTSQPAALFENDWREAINSAIAAFMKTRGLASSALAREDHRDLIAYLDSQGLFSLRGAAPYLTTVLGVSRATLYKHLKDARAGSPAKPA